jgi:hypothetical protein
MANTGVRNAYQHFPFFGWRNVDFDNLEGLAWPEGYSCA